MRQKRVVRDSFSMVRLRAAWAAPVIESASSKIMILNGGQDFPLQQNITQRTSCRTYFWMRLIKQSDNIQVKLTLVVCQPLSAEQNSSPSPGPPESLSHQRRSAPVLSGGTDPGCRQSRHSQCKHNCSYQNVLHVYFPFSGLLAQLALHAMINTKCLLLYLINYYLSSWSA